MKAGEWYLLHDMNPEFDGQFGYVYTEPHDSDEVINMFVPNAGSRRCSRCKLEKLDPSVGDLLTAMYR